MEEMSLDRIYNTGVRLKREGKYADAVCAFRRGLQRDKDHVPTLVGLGSLLREHPELQPPDTGDYSALLNRASYHVTCPPELKKAATVVIAANRFLQGTTRAKLLKGKGKDDGGPVIPFESDTRKVMAPVVELLGHPADLQG